MEKLGPCACVEMISAHLNISLDNYRSFNFGLTGYATVILVSIGLLGNAALLSRVVRHGALRRRLGFQLRMLCFWDSLLLVTRFLCPTLPVMIHKILPYHGWAGYLAFAVNPISNFAVSGTILQVVMITMERHLHVLHPFRAHIYDQRVSIKLISILIILFSALFNISQYFEFVFLPCIDVMNGGKKTFQVRPSETAENPIYKLVVHFIPDLLFRCPLPFLLVNYFTAHTVQFLHRRRSERRRSSLVKHRPKHKPKYKVTMALTLLSVKFLVCNTLFTVHGVIEVLQVTPDNYWSYFLSLLYLTDVSNFLLVLNGATNWIVFYHNWTPPGPRRSLNTASTHRFDTLTS